MSRIRNLVGGVLDPCFSGPKLKLLAQVAGFAILSAHLRIPAKQLSVCCMIPPIRKDRKKAT
jgi:hypothetical protein